MSVIVDLILTLIPNMNLVVIIFTVVSFVISAVLFWMYVKNRKLDQTKKAKPISMIFVASIFIIIFWCLGGLIIYYTLQEPTSTNPQQGNCHDLVGDGYAMGTDPEPVVIGNTCDFRNRN